MGQARVFFSPREETESGMISSPHLGVSTETHCPGTPILNPLEPPRLPGAGSCRVRGITDDVPHPHSVYLLLHLQDPER